jgi:hypothetical protein
MIVPGLHRSAHPEPLRRLLAAGVAGLVLALSVLAASPSLHAWLHPDAGHADHACAVTLFLQGMTAPAAEVALVVLSLLLVARLIGLPAEPDLLAPRYRLSPGRAPPVRLN